MSYNKLKSLVANVEAIETVMKIQVQGRQATVLIDPRSFREAYVKLV